jgi:hypothetical protein
LREDLPDTTHSHRQTDPVAIVRQAQEWRIRTAVAVKTISAVLGIGLWWGSGSLYLHYAKTRPSTPDLEAARIYAYQQVGQVFYLNAQERLHWRCLMLAALVCLLVMAASHFYGERLKADASTESGPPPPIDWRRRHSLNLDDPLRLQRQFEPAWDISGKGARQQIREGRARFPRVPAGTSRINLRTRERRDLARQ